jgi:hypothetical protein
MPTYKKFAEAHSESGNAIDFAVWLGPGLAQIASVAQNLLVSQVDALDR